MFGNFKVEVICMSKKILAVLVLAFVIIPVAIVFAVNANPSEGEYTQSELYNINTLALSLAPEHNPEFDWIDFVSIEQLIIAKEYFGVEGVFYQDYVLGYLIDVLGQEGLQALILNYDSVDFDQNTTDFNRILARMIEANNIAFLTATYEFHGVVPNNRGFFNRDLTNFPLGCLVCDSRIERDGAYRCR